MCRLRPWQPHRRRARRRSTRSTPPWPRPKITAETRTEFGKGAARRIRRADKVPAVLYGHGADPHAHHPAGPRHDAGAQARRRQRAARPSTSTARTSSRCPSRSSATRSRASSSTSTWSIVRKGEKVTVEIPVHVDRRGRRRTPWSSPSSTTVTVEAEATHIPEYVEVSVEGAEVGDQILAKDLALPEGSTARSPTTRRWSST